MLDVALLVHTLLLLLFFRPLCVSILGRCPAIYLVCAFSFLGRLLEKDTVILRSIEARHPYIDPLNLIQVKNKSCFSPVLLMLSDCFLSTCAPVQSLRLFVFVLVFSFFVVCCDAPAANLLLEAPLKEGL